MQNLKDVAPAKAGVQNIVWDWIPAFAGMTVKAAFFGITILLPIRMLAAAPAPSAPAAAPASPDMLLLDQESKFAHDKTQYLQENVLDKILGPGKAVVIVDVEMGLESRNTEMGMGKK